MNVCSWTQTSRFTEQTQQWGLLHNQYCSNNWKHSRWKMCTVLPTYSQHEFQRVTRFNMGILQVEKVVFPEQSVQQTTVFSDLGQMNSKWCLFLIFRRYAVLVCRLMHAMMLHAGPHQPATLSFWVVCLDFRHFVDNEIFLASKTFGKSNGIVAWWHFLQWQ